MDNNRQSKRRIYYIREYRHFKVSFVETVVFMLLCVLPVGIVTTLFYAPASAAACGWLTPSLERVLGTPIETIGYNFIPGLGQVSALSLDGCLPTRLHAVIVLCVALLVLIITRIVRRVLNPVLIYMNMALAVLVASCIFFIFWPEYFPYTLSDFSALYMIQQASLNILLPVLLGVALALLPACFGLKYLMVLACVASNYIMMVARYAGFLVVLAKFSSLYMASLYFSLGVLFDFIRTVMFFTFAAKRVSEKMQTPEGREQWHWV
ncbi:MAG: hypothetical protein Q4B73_00285 [Lachnospiraceae bacterium]|nr:hypothetical protein [Lachnospiraceae bacterium]